MSEKKKCAISPVPWDKFKLVQVGLSFIEDVLIRAMANRLVGEVVYEFC